MEKERIKNKCPNGPLERFHLKCSRFKGRGVPTARPPLRMFRENIPALETATELLKPL